MNRFEVIVENFNATNTEVQVHDVNFLYEYICNKDISMSSFYEVTFLRTVYSNKL